MKQLTSFHDLREESDIEAALDDIMAGLGQEAVEVEKHKPGGKDHEQSDHTNKNLSSSEKTSASGATGEPGSPFLQASAVPSEDEAFVTEIYNRYLSEAGARIEHVAEVAGMDQMSSDVKRGMDTKGMYGQWDGDSYSGYTEDRAEWQAQVLAEMGNEQAAANGMEPKQERRAVVMLGLPGAGKSHLIANELNEVIDTREFLTINADDIKTKIVYEDTPPEIEGVSGMELASMVHEESSTMRKAWEAKARSDGTNIILDITGGDRDKTMKALGLLNDSGYHITLVHADVSVAEAKASALARAATGGQGEELGRISPERFISGMVSEDFEGHDVIDVNFTDYLAVSNKAYVYRPFPLNKYRETTDHKPTELLWESQ